LGRNIEIEKYYIDINEIEDFCCKEDKIIIFHFEKFVVENLKLPHTPKVVDILFKDYSIEFKRVVPNENKGKYYSSIKELDDNIKEIAEKHLKKWKIDKKYYKSREIAKKYLNKDIKKFFVLFCYAEQESFESWLKRVFKNINKLALLQRAERVDILKIYDEFYTEISKQCEFNNGSCDKLRALIISEYIYEN
jgi:hypothetical protein